MVLEAGKGRFSRQGGEKAKLGGKGAEHGVGKLWEVIVPQVMFLWFGYWD